MEKEDAQLPTPTSNCPMLSIEGQVERLTLKAKIQRRVQEHRVASGSGVVCDAFESSQFPLWLHRAL